MPKRRFVLVHKRSPGDIICLTAIPRDLHLQYPGQFEIDVDTRSMDLWRHNPYLTRLWNHDSAKPVAAYPDVEFLSMKYQAGLTAQNHETVHFVTWFHRDFQQQTGIAVQPQRPYGDLHLSQQEQACRVVEGRYWVLLSGGKSDYPIKVWDWKKYQEVVDRLRELGAGVVQIGGNDRGHWHPPLDGVLNLVARTNIRDWMRLISQADGVICGITGSMHMAAALQRPCVVVGGGREAWYWEAYCRENRGLGRPELLQVPHRYLHTIGQLDCCRFHGCWRNRTVGPPVKAGGKQLLDDRQTCKRPVHLPHMPVPECLHRITPDHVMTAVMSYYLDGTLPPLNAEHAAELRGLQPLTSGT